MKRPGKKLFPGSTSNKHSSEGSWTSFGLGGAHTSPKAELHGRTGKSKPGLFYSYPQKDANYIIRNPQYTHEVQEYALLQVALNLKLGMFPAVLTDFNRDYNQGYYNHY